MGKKEKSGSCTVERGRNENEMMVRNRLIWMPSTITWGHVMSKPVLLSVLLLGLWPGHS